MARRILIVDDEPYVRRIVSFTLRRVGFATLEAPTAEHAEELLAEHPVDLIVLDVTLATSTSGFELAARLRRDEATRDLPIIMLTARGYASDVLRGRQLGAAGYLTKPFSTDDLVARVRAILD